MIRLPAAIGLALGVAGCGQPHELPANQQSASEKATAPSATGNIQDQAGSTTDVAPPGRAAGNASLENAQTSLPPSSSKLRFVGAWATSEKNCASRVWRFTEKSLTSADGPHCSFYDIRQLPGGYDLAAQCSTKKPVAADLIKVRFAQSARAMLVESNAIAPTGLIYCGK